MAGKEAQARENKPLLDKEPEDELHGCGALAACNPKRRLHRYLVLIFICTLSFGSYFCYDNPAALQKEIQRDMNVNTQQYTLLYSLYSWPNVILSCIGGYLIDRVFGIRLGAIVFSICVLSGQIVFALGAYIGSYFTMESGRFIFGKHVEYLTAAATMIRLALLSVGAGRIIVTAAVKCSVFSTVCNILGGENLAVAQNTYSVAWFKGKELNLVFGLQLSISRVGSTVNLNVMRNIYNMFAEKYGIGHVTLGWTLFFGILLCLMSLFAALVLAFFDRRANRILRRDESQTGEEIRLSDIKDFPLSLWLIFGICVAYYVAVFPFVSLGILFFEYKYDLTPASASIVNSIIFLVSAGASPVFGFLVDRTGRNLLWILVGVIMTLGCHVYLAFTFWTPFVAMAFMGISYSIVACALWPLVALVVPEYQLGTAYGIMQSIQNLGLALINMAAGAIVDAKGYLFLEVFFCAWLCLALFFSILLYLSDASKDGKLNLSTKQRLADALLPKTTLTFSTESESNNAPYTYAGQSPIKPSSAQQLRFRYLSRVGKQEMQLPVHYRSSALSYPHLLK